MTFGKHPELVEETLYAAIELSKKSWLLSIARPDREKPSIYRLPGGDFDALVARLRASAGAVPRIVVCYEAGYDGFWLARRLTEIEIECRVLDPASLQVNRRARRVKTDRIDALMLLRAVIAIDRGDHHVCAVVRVPSVEEEDARRSHRERQRLIRERTGHINRIKGLLFGQGIRGASSRNYVRPPSIFPPLLPLKVTRCPSASAVSWNANMPVWRLSKIRSGQSKKSAICQTSKPPVSKQNAGCFSLYRASGARLRRFWHERFLSGRSRTDPISAPILA